MTTPYSGCITMCNKWVNEHLNESKSGYRYFYIHLESHCPLLSRTWTFHFILYFFSRIYTSNSFYLKVSRGWPMWVNQNSLYQFSHVHYSSCFRSLLLDKVQMFLNIMVSSNWCFSSKLNEMWPLFEEREPDSQEILGGW